MSAPPLPVNTATLEEIGLYNLLTRVSMGRPDMDPFLLVTLQEKGLVAPDSLALSEAGAQRLQDLIVKFGASYP